MYLFFFATPGALIMSILGLVKDKRKWLAVITMLLSIALAVFVFNLC